MLNEELESGTPAAVIRYVPILASSSKKRFEDGVAYQK
jgi:hypothetical protein